MNKILSLLWGFAQEHPIISIFIVAFVLGNLFPHKHIWKVSDRHWIEF